MEITTKKAADFTRIFDLIQYQKEKYPNTKALNFFKNNLWQSITIDEFGDRVDALSCWFIENEYKQGEKIILVPFIGNPEWMILDFACQQAGLITVPIHPNLPNEEVNLILNETESRLCIITNQSLKQFEEVVILDKKNIQVNSIESDASNYFKPLSFRKPNADSPDKLQDIKKQIREDDIVTILYTSGSSGVPKGVMLTHRNIIHNIKSILTFVPLEPKHRVISFLPFSHILERATTYGYLAFGVSIYFSESRESFEKDFKSVRPYFSTSVPRVLEKMYDYLQQQLISKNALKRITIKWAIEVGKQYKERKRIGFVYGIRLFFARLLVLRYWRKMLGGKMRYMIVGAAALRPEIGRLVSASGIQVVEGYGLTETAPLVSVNRFEPGMNHFGTVGLVIPGVEIKFDRFGEEDDGEILVKGPNVMKGYFKRPELTQAAFTQDGWFRTGDIGKMTDHHFLQITDRKKEIFKTSSGKYIAPLPLQNHFTKSSFVQRCLIIGFQRPFVIALMVPHFSILETWCKLQDIHWTSPEFMIHNIKVIEKFNSEVDVLNEELANYQQVRGFVLCPREWSAEEGEITATLKPVRKTLENNYKKEIDKLYNRLATF